MSSSASIADPFPALRQNPTTQARPGVAFPAAREADPIESERMKRFGAALDAIKARVEASLGKVDADHIKRVRRFSTAMEVTGRLLIHFSPEPVSFLAGVTALWLHQQLEATEVGHTALHGAYDKIPGAEKFKSEGFHWDIPIDEESWKY